jgi:hypothetical protein
LSNLVNERCRVAAICAFKSASTVAISLEILEMTRKYVRTAVWFSKIKRANYHRKGTLEAAD